MAISQLIDLEFDKNWVHVSRVETEVINISWISFFQYKWPSSEVGVIYEISWCAYRSKYELGMWYTEHLLKDCFCIERNQANTTSSTL